MLLNDGQDGHDGESDAKHKVEGDEELVQPKELHLNACFCRDVIKLTCSLQP